MSPDAITAVLAHVPASHRPTVFQAVTGGDPSKCPMPCEAPGCDEVVALEDTYSHAAGLMRHTGRGDVPSFVCPESVFGQHYYCSEACLMRGHDHCLREHLLPELHRRHAEVDRAKAEISAEVAP